MSAVQRLLCIGLSAAMTVQFTACGYRAANVSVDNRGQDITMPEIQDPIGLSAEDIVSMASASMTIREILPSFSARVKEKQRENKDVVGWLQIPGTAIDTPIVQNPTENNDFSVKNNYYLNTDFYGNPDKNGTFCADYRASFGANGRKSLSRITAIYAHSWDDRPNGTLFSPLKYYRDEDFARAHPYIYFSTGSEEMVWEVFAVFDTTIYLPYVRPNLPDDKFVQTLDMIYALTYYHYDVAVGEQDKLLALSTCTYSVDGHANLPAENDYRFVVMAKYVEPDAPRKTEAVFSVNTSRLSPDATRALWKL